jgi:hypothetical protein
MIGYQCDQCKAFFGGPGSVVGWTLARSEGAIDIETPDIGYPSPPFHFCSLRCVWVWTDDAR